VKQVKRIAGIVSTRGRTGEAGWARERSDRQRESIPDHP
jgi:hypothetical protein